MTEQNRTEQNRTEQNRTEQNNNCSLLKKSSTSLSQKIIYVIGLALLAAGVIYLWYFSIGEVLAVIDNARTTTTFVIRLVGTFLIMTLLFVWLSTKKFWLRLLILVIVFLPTALEWYIGFRYDALVNAIFFGHILNTNPQEAANVFDRYAFLFLACLGVFFAVLAIIIGKLKVELFPFANNKLRTACSIGFVVLLLCSFHIHFYPMRVYYGVQRYFRQANRYWAGAIRDTMFLEQRERPWSLSAPIPEDGILVVHIGETVRSDHLPMNGYERNTMPRLMKEYQAGRLLNFPNAIAFGYITRFSVSGIMTPASIADPVIRSGSFLSVLKKAGVPCFAFFDGGIGGGETKMDFNMSIFVKNAAEAVHSPGGLAHTLLPLISGHLENKDGAQLIIYQGVGSHFPYSAYDQERFSVWTPVNFNMEQKESTINAYDNTIVYTDDFIASFTDMLKDKSAVYIYTSDHGSMFGENGVWGRGKASMDIPEQRRVAFFIWVSDGFCAKYPAKANTLKNNAARLSAVSHDHVYHTVLGFFNIRNEEYDASLDLFSQGAKPFAGPFPEDLPAGTFLTEIPFDID